MMMMMAHVLRSERRHRCAENTNQRRVDTKCAHEFDENVLQRRFRRAPLTKRFRVTKSGHIDVRMIGQHDFVLRVRGNNENHRRVQRIVRRQPRLRRDRIGASVNRVGQRAIEAQLPLARISPDGDFRRQPKRRRDLEDVRLDALARRLPGMVRVLDSKHAMFWSENILRFGLPLYFGFELIAKTK